MRVFCGVCKSDLCMLCMLEPQLRACFIEQCNFNVHVCLFCDVCSAA